MCGAAPERRSDLSDPYRVAVGVYGKEGRWWEVLRLLEEADRRYPDLGELKPLAESLGVDRKRTR